MKLSSAANFSLLAFPACLVTTFFVAHANPNNLKGEIKDFQDHRNLRNRKAKEIEIDNSLPTLPPTIEGMDKDNPIMLFSGSTDNSNSTTLKNELTDSSSAVVTAEIIPPDSLDETITLQAIVTNWQSCTIGVDTCADGWRCCVLFLTGKAVIMGRTFVRTILDAVLHQRIALLRRRQRAKINAPNALSKLITSPRLMPLKFILQLPMVQISVSP